MADRRLTFLLLAATGLGVLFWLDLRSRSTAPDAAAPAAGEARLEAGRGEGDVPSGPGAAAAQQSFAGEFINPLASLDKQALRDIAERPLFAPSRRPPPLPPIAVETTPAFAPPPAPAAPDYVLLGIIRGGDRATALLRSRSDGRNLRVEAGDTVGGWEIASVDSVSVRLTRRDGAAHELRLAPR